jgi:hypothetical protein
MNGTKLKTSSANSSGQWKLGLGTRFGSDWPGRRCLAKTRQGGECQKPALKNKSRCQLHGGRSTGPRTEEGRSRISASHYKHGMRTNERIAADRARAQANREIWAALRERIALIIADGILPPDYKI